MDQFKLQVEDIVKVIFQLETDNQKAIAGLNEVNAKYVDTNKTLALQQTELRKLVAQETELLAARAKSNNPTVIAQHNQKLKETHAQINTVKAAIDATTASTDKLKKGTTDLGTQVKTAFDATKINGFNNSLKGTTNEFTNLRKQIKDANGELLKAFGSGNQAAIQAASQKLGKLKDQMNDLRETAAAFASGSKFQQIGNLFGSVGSNLFQLDFERAKEQSQALLATTKSITFAEAGKGIKDLGSSLLNVGASLLTNPIFLLGTVFSLLLNYLPQIIEKFGLFTSEAEKNARAVAEMESSMKKANAVLDGQIDLLDDQIRKLKELKAPLSEIIAKYKELEGVKLEKLSNELKIIQEKQKGVSATLSTGVDVGGGDLFSTVNRLGGAFFGPSKKDKEAAKNAGRENQAAIIQNANERKKVERETENAIAEETKRRNQAAKEAANKASEDRIKAMQDLLAKRAELEEELAQANARADATEAEAKQKALEEQIAAIKKAKQEEKDFRDAILIANAADDAAAKESEEGRAARIKKQHDERMALIVQEIDALGHVANAAVNAAEVSISIKEKEVDRLAELQEKRVADAKAIAENGNAELLELEQKRLEDIQKKKEKFVNAQKALSLVEVGINTSVAIAKAAAQGGVAAPITIATTIAAILAGLAQAASIATNAGGSFYEGGYTGDGDPTQESRALGKKRYTYHKSEFVMNHDKTARYRDIFEGIHKGNIDLREWQTKVKAFESMKALSMVANPNADNSAMEGKLDMIFKAISGQSTSVSLDENGLALRFKNIRSRQDFIKNHLARA